MLAQKLKQIDLHFHAGLERDSGATLADYLEHAWQTGRRYMGITDHVDLYTEPGAENKGYCYPAGMEGLRHFRRELDGLRSRYPGLTCFFAPEFSHKHSAEDQAIYNVDEIPAELVEISDYIICDLSMDEIGLEDIPGRTSVIVNLCERIQRLVKMWDKPFYLAHPFRDVVVRKFTRRDSIDEGILAGLQDHPNAILDETLNRLFSLDVIAIGRAARENKVPLEINGITQYCIRSLFLPQAYPAYLQAYARMAAEGARFVAGTDQHQIDMYPNIDNWTEPFERLGASILDVDFYQRIGI